MREDIVIKHFMHSAKDLPITYEFDAINQSIRIEIPWIDTLLLQRFLQNLIREYDDELARVGQGTETKDLRDFTITLNVAHEAVYEVQLIERAFEPKETTLVLRVKE